MDKVRRYWDKRPCNIRHSSAKIGSEQYFREVEARKYFVEPHILRFAEFSRWQGKRVLELGCGIGTDTISFARAGANVTAIDISPKSLELLRRRAKTFSLKNILLYEGNAEELTKLLPWDTPAFDLVYAFGLVHHTPHPNRVMDEISRFSQPGTTLKLMFYNRYSWKVLWILLAHRQKTWRRLERLVAKYSEAQQNCPITYTFTKRQIRRLLENHGFRITEMWVDHIFPYEIPEYRRYRYRKVWYFRYLPKPIFRLLERLFGWHICVTAQRRQG